MIDTGKGPPAKKPMTGKRMLLWGLGGLFGLSLVGVIVSPPPKPSPAAPAAPRVDEDNVEDLRESMKPIGAQGQIFAFPIPADARALDVEAAAKAHCAENGFCQVYGWQDTTQLPGAWPMLDREFAALSFRYALNRDSGYEETIWYCGSLGAKPGCTKAGAN